MNANADALSRRPSRPLDETSTQEDQRQGHKGAREARACLVVDDELQNAELHKKAMEQEQDVVLGDVKSWDLQGRPPAKQQLRKLNRNLRTLARFFDQLTEF